jgi:hypothetical protein
MHRGQLMLDCMEVNGTASCVTDASDELVACAPKLDMLTDVPLDQFVAQGTGSDGKEGSICPLAPLPGQTEVHAGTPPPPLPLRRAFPTAIAKMG